MKCRVPKPNLTEQSVTLPVAELPGPQKIRSAHGGYSRQHSSHRFGGGGGSDSMPKLSGATVLGVGLEPHAELVKQCVALARVQCYGAVLRCSDTV